MPQVPGFLQRALDANADPASGASLLAFQAGTTTAQTLYLDEARNTPTTPTSDAAGAVPAAYMPAGKYKFDVRDSNGASLPGYPLDNVSVPDAGALLVSDQRDGALFNVLDYISAETGGGAQVGLIISRDHAAQDRDIVTTGIQKAFVAWSESGETGAIHFPSGGYAINDEFLSGVRADGRTVAQWIREGGLNVSGNIEIYLFISGLGYATEIYVDETFVSTEARIDKCVIRFEQPTKRTTGPTIIGLTFLYTSDRADRWKCPTAIKVTNVNFMRLRDIAIRGEADWPGCGLHAENVNNAVAFDVRIKGGRTALMHDLWEDGGFTVDVTNTGTRISSPGRFAGTDSADWVGVMCLLETDLGQEFTEVVKIASKIDDSTLEIDPSYTPADRTGVNIGVERVRCGTTASSASITFKTPVLNSDMEGELIHVLGAGDESSNTGKGVLSAYIKPGSISVDNRTCTLVAVDGTTEALAEATLTDAVVVFQPATYIGQSAHNQIGSNNEFNLYGLNLEKGRGGCQMLIERAIEVNFHGSKFHGRDADGGEAAQCFTECGDLIIFDDCKKVNINEVILTWPSGINFEDERGTAFQIFGRDNQISMGDYGFNGLMSKMDIFDISKATGQPLVVMHGSGRMKTPEWGGAGYDHRVIGVTAGTGTTSARNVIFASGLFMLDQSGSGLGPVNLLEPYLNLDSIEPVTISNGAISPRGCDIIRVVVANPGSSDNLDQINGLFDGAKGRLVASNGSDPVVLRNGVGNIQTPDGMDITLNQTRDSVSFWVVNGFIRLSSVAT